MRLLILSITLILFVGCQSETEKQAAEPETNGTFVGEPFELNGVVPASSIIPNLSEEESDVMRVEGTVVEVCQSKGCWMTFETGTPVNMRITFLDYGFFVPKDLAGKDVVLEGKAWMEKKSVETLRHYAEDAGKSDEEIAAITQAETEYLFEASGVYLP